MKKYLTKRECFEKLGHGTMIDNFLKQWGKFPVMACDLYKEYSDFAIKNGEIPVTSTMFGLCLNSRNVIKARTNKGFCYYEVLNNKKDEI